MSLLKFSFLFFSREFACWSTFIMNALKFSLKNSNIWFILVLVLVYFFFLIWVVIVSLAFWLQYQEVLGPVEILYFSRQSPCLDLGHKSWITFVGCSSNDSLISGGFVVLLQVAWLCLVFLELPVSPADAAGRGRRDLPRPVLLMLVGEGRGFSAFRYKEHCWAWSWLWQDSPCQCGEAIWCCWLDPS